MCDSNEFFDSLDEFVELPFFDCENIEESEEFVELPKVSQLDEDGAADAEVNEAKYLSEKSFPNGLRRRSSFRFPRQESSGNNAKDSSSSSPVISEISQVFETITHRERRNEILCALKDQENVSDSSNEQNQENSTLTSANNEVVDKSGIAVDSPPGDRDESSSNFLVFLAGLLIKAIGFQISVLVSFITFPIWLLYSSSMLLIDPFRVVRRAKGYLIAKIWNVFCGSITPYIHEKLKGQKSIGKMALRIGWGLFWSIYVCFTLLGLLVSAFVIGGFTMRYLVEEPIRMTETLNFDYTKPSPVAFVPIRSCPSVSCGVNCKEKVEVGKPIVIPPNHKFQLTVSLTLPESEYNRKLGVFQVRADFLSINGKVTASSSYPCILRFKSQPFHLLETFIKSIPLLAGYSSESQILTLKMRGFTEGKDPNACLRVVLEQRAEYRRGAGIPEIYDAHVVLESELPLLKRIIWYWKKTLFIWISMMSFIMELMLVLVCCRPLIIPRARPRSGSANINSPQTNVS